MDPSGAEGRPFELGKAAVTHEGTDATIIACGAQVVAANRAAGRLAQDGIHARVLYCHTVKPLDHAAVLAAARDTGAIVTVEDHTTIGGLGGAVAETLADAGAGVKDWARRGKALSKSTAATKPRARCMALTEPCCTKLP